MAVQTDQEILSKDFLEKGLNLEYLCCQRILAKRLQYKQDFDKARGKYYVTLDSDLQNDPKDIPKVLNKLINEKLDLVVGWRKNRKDNFFLRNFPSMIANGLIGRITGVKLNDYGCSLKAYNAGILKEVRLYGEMQIYTKKS